MKSTATQEHKQRLIDVGLSHHNASQINEAVKCYQTVLELFPKDPDALHFLGVAYLQTHEDELALEFLEKAISLKPDSSDVFNHYGCVLLKINYFELAETAFRNSIKLDTSNAEALYNLGNLIISEKELNGSLSEILPERIFEAVTLLSQATEHQPHQSIWQVKLAQSLIEYGDKSRAKSILDAVIDKKADIAEAYFTRALSEKQDRRDLDLIRCILLKPESERAINNLGFSQFKQGNAGVVVPLFEKAVMISPNDPSIRWGLANALLTTGNLNRGWIEARCRHLKTELRINRVGLPKEWDGAPINNGKLIVYQEQGIGDELRFSSCFNDLIRQASAPCIVETDARLIPLFSRSFPKIEFIGKLPRSLEKISKVEFSELVKHCDISAHVALGDLPLHLRPTVHCFSDNSAHLTPDQESRRLWRMRLDELGPNIKIGFCWNTALPHKEYEDYFFGIEELAPILLLKNINLVNLQPTECETELKAIEQRFNINVYRPEPIDMFNELDNVAALIKEVDFVVGPMTAVIAMAGAVGTRCFGISLHPDWTCLGTSQQLWTPEMTCFYKRNSSSWDPVMREIASLIYSAP